MPGLREARQVRRRLRRDTVLTMSTCSLTLFWRSLRNHPGVPYGFVWIAAVASSILARPDFHALPLGRVFVVLGVVGAIPWPIILWTAWKLRSHYADR